MPPNLRLMILLYVYAKQSKPNLSKKLSPNFKGPYRICKTFSNHTAELQVGNKKVKYHTNLLKHFIADIQINDLASPSSSNTNPK